MNRIELLASLLTPCLFLSCAPGTGGPPPSPTPATITLAQGEKTVPLALASALFEEVVKAGINSPEEIEALRKERGFTPMRFFVAERVDLDADGRPELLVKSSRNEVLCTTANCPVWIYRMDGEHYERLLADVAGTIDAMIVLGTSTQGMRDIRIQQHSSASQRDVVVYRYDGKSYRPGECTTDTYDVTDRGVEKVRTVARTCP